MSLKKHNISVEVSGYVVEHWLRYNIQCDMLTPDDRFSMEIGPCTPDLYNLVVEDSDITVLVDGTKILTGFIEERRYSFATETIAISGRDKGGRLVDESMPLTSFAGMDLRSLAQAVVAPWFSNVTLSNAENRDLMRGRRGRKAAANREPPIIFDPSKAPKKVEPGETRWQVLLNWLEPAKLLAWSTADGDSFVIGLPNYDQDAQFAFLHPAKGSKRAHLGNVLDGELTTGCAERYSQITVMGACKGTSARYGRNVLENRGVAKDGTGINGIGANWQHAKTLIITDDEVKSRADAVARAEREMAVRDASAATIQLTVAGHGQSMNRGASPTLFAFDTVCQVESEPIELEGRYLITAVEFSCGRDEAEVTRLTLVPEGTVLTQ